MGAHIINGEFQSDKYPTTPRGKVPLSVKDKTAQDLLWEYAQRRREVDAEFSADLEECLRAAGYSPCDKTLVSAYKGYLLARASGRPQTKIGAPSMADMWAVALGVYHFDANIRPVSLSAFSEMLVKECAP